MKQRVKDLYIIYRQERKKHLFSKEQNSVVMAYHSNSPLSEDPSSYWETISKLLSGTNGASWDAAFANRQYEQAPRMSLVPSTISSAEWQHRHLYSTVSATSRNDRGNYFTSCTAYRALYESADVQSSEVGESPLDIQYIETCRSSLDTAKDLSIGLNKRGNVSLVTFPIDPRPRADNSPQRSCSSKYILGPEAWAGTPLLPRFVMAAEAPGEGVCYFYDDGSHCQTTIEGKEVNAWLGVTKAGKPRRRLAIACKGCRERKIKCDPGVPRCKQCDKFGRVCKFENVLVICFALINSKKTDSRILADPGECLVDDPIQYQLLRWRHGPRLSRMAIDPLSVLTMPFETEYSFVFTGQRANLKRGQLGASIMGLRSLYRFRRKARNYRYKLNDSNKSNCTRSGCFLRIGADLKPNCR